MSSTPLALFHPTSRSARRRAPQRGIALLVVLVMVTLISLGAAATLKQTLQAELIGQHVRMESVAWQAAQQALRHCEAASLQQPPGITIQAAPAAPEDQPAWALFSYWRDDAGHPSLATRVPTPPGASTGDPAPPRPQCMAGYSQADTVRLITITARGFSPDYQGDAQGRTLQGSVVWLQSTIAASEPAAETRPPTRRSWRQLLHPPRP